MKKCEKYRINNYMVVSSSQKYLRLDKNRSLWKYNEALLYSSKHNIKLNFTLEKKNSYYA